MLTIETLPLGELSTNCYLAWCPSTLTAVIIDPADSGDFITERILHHQLTPKYILLTHGHFDHVLAVLELKLNFQLPILMHPADNALLKTARQSTQHWLHRDPGPVPPADQALHAGQTIAIGKEHLTVLETPGHTPGSVSFYNQEVIFSGDTLFATGVGRTDFKYSDEEKLHHSLTKLLDLPPTLTLLPGHGEACRLQDCDWAREHSTSSVTDYQ
ncbi:MAG TPA: MBL fold metallo-hydrolase [Vitreimonas sp.]|nr:MBL fold metallo-hydrolase [Vitreimonas sp.]